MPAADVSLDAHSYQFSYARTIRFQETDAAGVVYFANLLVLCHEAYEAALAAAGFDVGLFFSSKGAIAVPIVHTTADFYQPLRCGDAIAVSLMPTQISPYGYEIRYEIQLTKIQLTKIQLTTRAEKHKKAACALTRHLCIDSNTRRRAPLPPELAQWIASFA